MRLRKSLIPYEERGENFKSVGLGIWFLGLGLGVLGFGIWGLGV